MAWSKLGRWVCVGLLGMTGAAACGGRGSLPVGDFTDGDAGGESSFGGVSNGGGGKGGKGGKGGTAGVAGVGGSGGTCAPPGTTICVGTSIAKCDTNGKPSGVKPCGAGLTCVATGSGAACAPATICKPGQVQCDDTGTLVEVCSPDGTSLSTTTDCTKRGQRCLAGSCQSLACQPNQRFCDDTGVRLCSADGTQSTLVLACGQNQYCDPATLTCKKGICPPNKPVCDGSVATTCNADGSGYVGAQVDCGKLLDKQCVLGACVCTPSLADCDSLGNNGCEINVSNDPDNCTGCGFACSSNHVAKRSCDNGCDGTCEAGYEDCNSDKLKDGCETSLNADAKNCGDCGAACSNNHVTPSCSQGQCSGQCSANFGDCNLDKRTDGCETDLRSDAGHCGDCGTSCSDNNIKPACSAGVCSGACLPGFDDCNSDKQTDGCEVDTRTDPQNCGKCGMACGAGQACVASKCVSLLTFTGVAQNLAVSALVGWTQCYTELYGQSVTSLSAVNMACPGSLLMMACRRKGTDTLQLAAYAPKTDVMFDTGTGNTPHDANGVGWYYSSSYSWGFAPEGDTINRNSCDVQDSALGGGNDGDKRLCWHTSANTIQGGWRCGKDDELNSDMTFERLLFTAQ